MGLISLSHAPVFLYPLAATVDARKEMKSVTVHSVFALLHCHRFVGAADAVREALTALAAGSWGQRYPTIVRQWDRHWPQIISFFTFPPEVRRVIYTTNAIESLHMRLRKIMKSRSQLPTDHVAIRLLSLALQNMHGHSVRSAKSRHDAMNQFAIVYGDRFTERTA